MTIFWRLVGRFMPKTYDRVFDALGELLLIYENNDGALDSPVERWFDGIKELAEEVGVRKSE